LTREGSLQRLRKLTSVDYGDSGAMPTLDRSCAITLDQARLRAGRKGFRATARGGRIGKVGLEPEFFTVALDDSGRPAGRVPLEGEGGVLATIDGLVTCGGRISEMRGPPSGPWEYHLAGGGRLTFEPGAQIEHSTTVYVSAADALADVREVVAFLQRGFDPTGVALVAAGIDLWHDLESVPLQLRAGRYIAMAAYYDLRGPWGAVMMRHTCSLQLNLDLGPEGVWQERWLLANLLCPLTAATFAASPSGDAVCVRARAWQELDPTRTGFPRLLVSGASSDPREQWAEAALAADVMLVRQADGSAAACDPGFSFVRWIADGHPEFGWPTACDLDYHLTTLFFEVRPRGFLELRTCEALPGALRPAPVVLISGLLYDDQARVAAIELLEGTRDRLPELWQRAGVQGVRDVELGPLAARVWEVGLEGAGRLPRGFFDDGTLAVARRFLDTYTLRGRMPADDLRELQEEDPAKALEWARA
jgi:glutamate--cysteine ligase